MKSWSDLLGEVKQANFVYTDLFALIGAAYLSRTWEGEPLWIHVVGPPSTGKSFTMKQFTLLPQLKLVSALTPAALISGYGGEAIDRSLLAEMQGVLLMAKDFGTILEMGYDSIRAVFSILREAFDGHVKKTFGMLEREYFPHFNFIAASTEACEKQTAFRGQLGERFLRYRHRDVSFANPPPEVSDALRSAVADWFRQREEEGAKHPLDKTELVQIARLSSVAAKVRTPVIHKGWRGEIAQVPGFEGPYRLARQFKKLMEALLFMTNDREESLRLLKKVGSHALKPQREIILR